MDIENVMEIKKDLQVHEWKNRLKDRSSFSFLQERLDLAEKHQKKLFTDFSDVEMIHWFLYRKEHWKRF
jgi:integrase/recombinase XerD